MLFVFMLEFLKLATKGLRTCLDFLDMNSNINIFKVSPSLYLGCSWKIQLWMKIFGGWSNKLVTWFNKASESPYEIDIGQIRVIFFCPSSDQSYLYHTTQFPPVYFFNGCSGSGCNICGEGYFAHLNTMWQSLHFSDGIIIY